MSTQTSESEKDRQRFLQLIEDGLAQSRVSTMHIDESVDEEGKSLIDGLEEGQEEIKADPE